MRKTRVGFISLGCPKNQIDTEVMLSELVAAGYEITPEDIKADIIIVNTCAFIESAKKEAIDNILDVAWLKQKRLRGIIVTGCLAQRAADELTLPGVRLVLGTQRRGEVVELLEQAMKQDCALVAVETLRKAPFEHLTVHAHEGHTRATMKIQEGCDRWCTYCIIPSVRGPIRSRPVDEIAAEARSLAEAGFREVVLTGIHLTSYGRDAKDGTTLLDFPAPEIETYLDERAHDTFHVGTLTPDDFKDTRPRGVIGTIPGEIVTTDAGYAEKISVEDDILKIAVIERHKNTHHIGIGYIKGYGLKSGAVATSISHDSHNIIVVGTNEEDIAAAANRVVELGGGIVVLDHGEVLGEVRLQIAGIMSEEPLVDVNRELENAKEKAFALGVSRGVDPFMTLSFMALPVIPTLRLTTRGVFDTVTQKYV